MSKYCPDPKCEFWEDFPDGYPGKRKTECDYCSKKWVTEKPVFNIQTEIEPLRNPVLNPEESLESDIVPIIERTRSISTSSQEESIIDVSHQIHDTFGEGLQEGKDLSLDNNSISQNDPFHHCINRFDMESSDDILRTTNKNLKSMNSFMEMFSGKGTKRTYKCAMEIPVEHPIQMRVKERRIIIQFNTIIFKETFDKIEYICLKIGHKCFKNFCDSSEHFTKNSEVVVIQNREFVTIFGYVHFPIKYMNKRTIRFPYKYFYKLKDGTLDISEHLHHTSKLNYNRYFKMNVSNEEIDNSETCMHFDTMILPETKTSKKLGIVSPANMQSNFITSNGITDTNIPYYDVKERMLTSLLALLPSNFGCGYSPPCESMESFRLQFIYRVKSFSSACIHSPYSKGLDLWLNPEMEAEDSFKELVEAWMTKIYRHEQNFSRDPETVVWKFYLACCLLRDCEITTKRFNTLLTGMISESILQIIINESHKLDNFTTYFENGIKHSLYDFIFKRIMAGKYPEKVLTLIPIYHLITELKDNAACLHEMLDYKRNQYWGFPDDVQLKWLDHISFDSKDLQTALALAEYDPVLPYTIAMYTLNEGNAEIMCNHFINNPQFFPLSALMSVLLLRVFKESEKRAEVFVIKYGKLNRHVMEALCNCLTEDADFPFDDIQRLTLLTITFAVTLPSQYFDSHQFKLCLRLISNLNDYTFSLWELTIPVEKIAELFNKLVLNWYIIHVRRCHISFEDYYKEIQFWEDITTEYSFSQIFEWKDSVVKHLKYQFKDTYISQEFILHLLINHPTKDTIKEILINELHSRLDGIKSEERIVLVEILFNRFLEIDKLEELNILLSQILIDEEENFQHNSEQHFITWILWITYFSLNGREDIENILSKQANDMLEKARPKFSQLIKSINKMSIRVSLLKEIANKRDYFTSLATTFLQMDCTSEDTFSEVHDGLDKCLSLYEWVEEQRNLLKILSTFTGNIHMVEDECIRLFLADGFDNHEMDTICNFQVDSEIRLLQHPEISDIINFPHFRSICRICSSVQDSQIIMKVFETVINEKAPLHMKFDISIFYETIWLPAWGICITLFQKISDETIILSEMCKYLDATENYEIVESQLILLDSGCGLYQKDRKIVRKAPQSSVRKIHTFLSLLRCSQAATRICEMKELLLIKSDFEVIEKMTKANQQYFQKQLLEMDATIEGIAMSIAFLNIGIMEIIKENIHLFSWIRDNIDGLNAVKVFVDISLTTCGDNRVDVDRITSFSSVCTNFAPLIFGVDQNTGYEKFISICIQIVENVEKNNKLIKLLRQVGNNMRFWEDLKQSHGAVEETTIIQLDNIIKSGLFHFNLGESYNLNDMINLTISRENEESKLYTLEHLNEFRSKCMLVVGISEKTHDKSQSDRYKDFQRFDRTLNIIIDIANIIIQLEMNGQHEYHNYITHFSESETCLTRIQSKLTSLLHDFRNSIDTARDEYYFLNYYTTPQVVSLQKGIKSFLRGNENENLEQLYHLLRLLNHEVTEPVIQQAWRKSETKQLIQGITIVRLPSTKDLKKLIKRERSETGLPDQAELLEQFLPMSISHTRDSSIEVYSDIKRLSAFLGRISKTSTSTLEGERKLPDNMKLGIPNLVVIPSNEILDFVLTLYLTDDDNLPLPFYHEILFCTDQTTMEEVDIFWRRLMMNPQTSYKYLFCMVNIEKLKYEVAVRAFAEFKDKSTCGRLRNKEAEKYSYKLVLVCSKEEDWLSYLAAAFEDFKRSNIANQIPEIIRNK